MARPLNASSYYRANPFYQQGYLPDAALRNRKEPTHYSEIPQGWQHFDPTNKKHYQKQGYYSNIVQDRILSQQDDPAASRSRQKEYFRSLNVQDIEGASTNTLISQAVKNRMKAKEQLARRQQQQNQRDQIIRMQEAMKSHEDSMRERALQKLRNNSPINYHLAKNTQKQGHPPSFQKIEHSKEENIRQMRKEDQTEMYRRQLLKTERQLLQLQKKLASQTVNEEQKGNQYGNMPQRSASDLNLLPITNQPIVNSKNYHNYRQSNPEYDSNPNKKIPDSYHQHIPASNGSMNRHTPYQQSNPQRQIRDYQSLIQKQLQGPGGRSQHRRYNPTFLSYGSPTIGLAGKNIVGG